MEKYTRNQYLKISENMIKYGGSFFKAIGEALFRADLENMAKLQSVFEKEFERYLKY